MFLAIDLGTSSVKVMLVDADGVTQGVASQSYEVNVAHAGWGETHPEQWWAAVVTAVNQLSAEHRSRVRAIAYSGQMHGVVLCDALANALRPAILWLDTRAKDYLHCFPADSAAHTGNAPAAGMAASSLLWLKQHETRVYADARWALQPKDWLRFKMCGSVATDPSDACGTQLATLDGEWDLAWVESLGLRSDWLPTVFASHAIAGELTANAAQQLGLPVGVPLIVGAGDTPAAALGSGMLHDGESQLTTGTGGQIVVMRDERPGYAASLNAFRSANPDAFARWYVMAAMLNVGSALEWVRTLLGMRWDECYAGAAQAASDGLIFLPYLAGERTPLMDADAHGAWIGLRAATTKSQLMRAAFEGVAFSLRAGLDALRDAGHRPDALRLAGGGSVHPWWRQLMADALGVHLNVVDVAHASARGAALLAGIGIGHWSVKDLPQRTVSSALTVFPQDDSRLAQHYVRFRDLYTRLRG